MAALTLGEMELPLAINGAWSNMQTVYENAKRRLKKCSNFVKKMNLLKLKVSFFSAIFFFSLLSLAAEFEKGYVATSDSQATTIALQILSEGGNAVDAGVAAMFGLAVVQPFSTGLGGGGVMVVYCNNQAKAIDFREAAPLNADPKIYYQNLADFKVNSSIGWNSICVPGMIAGAAKALQIFGTKKLDEILQPVIKLAESGFPVSESLSKLFVKCYEHLEADNNSAAIFFPDWLPKRCGEKLTRPDLAFALKTIAVQGSDFFYQVEIADKIAGEMKAHNGLIRLPDLANYQAIVTGTIQQRYKQYELNTVAAPSSAGLALVELLKIVEQIDLKRYPLNSGEYIHIFIEAIKMALADRTKFLTELAEEKAIDFDVPLSQENILTKSKGLDSLFACTPSNIINSAVDIQSASQISVVDKDGNAISVAQTLNQFFGSGITLDEYGVLFNNTMNNFSREPNLKNSIKPGNRPLVSLAPTIVLLNNKPFLVIGGSGGERSISTMAQIFINIVEYNLSLEAAINSPRFSYNYYDDTIEMESRIQSEAIDFLKNLGHKILLKNSYDIYFGNIQAVLFDKNNLRFQSFSGIRQEEVVIYK